MRLVTKNKRAYLDYDIKETFDAGIQLKGFEVKSIKNGKCDIKDAFIKIRDGEAFITNMNIPLYEKTSINLVPSYQPKQSRKLLLKKKEISRLSERTHKTGFVLIPLKVFENKRKLIKLTIGLGKLRRKVEKKQIIKERDEKRQADKEIKRMGY